MYKSIVFDVDGTLVNSLEACYKFFKQICSEHGRPYTIRVGKGVYEIRKPEDLKPFFREPYNEIYDKLGFNWVKDREWIKRDYFTFMCKNIPSLVHGIDSVLKRLKEGGVLLGVVTSTEPELTEINLRSTGLYDLFDLVVANDEKRRAKPAPDYLNYWFQKMRINPETSAYIGDQPADIRAAKAAKTKPIGVTWGFSDYQTLLREEPADIARNTRMLEAVLSL